MVLNSTVQNSKDRLLRSSPEFIFLSFFCVGLTPKAPGTAGTLAIIPLLALLTHYHVPFFFLLPIYFILLLTSCFAAEYVQKKYQLHDPQWIVIDEVLGMTTAWFFLSNTSSLWHLVILFFLFRLFDIWKPWPVSFFDKKMKHGSGVILDDIVSGIIAGITYLIGLKIYSHATGIFT